jgi:hypothetical protein
LNTRLLLAASAIVMGAVGAGGLFLPDEFLSSLHVTGVPVLATVVQLYAALLVAFAMVNWTAKGSLIGGIYNRPVAIGNFVHFAIGAITLAKVVFGHGAPPFLWIAALVYAAFALAFGAVFFGSPVRPVSDAD